MDQIVEIIDANVIEVLDKCLKIDIDCCAISYGIIFNISEKLFVNEDMQIYPDITTMFCGDYVKFDKRFNSEVTSTYRGEYHYDYVVNRYSPKIGIYNVKYIKKVVFTTEYGYLTKNIAFIESTEQSVKAIIELYHLMNTLKVAGRIPEDAYIGNVRWGDDD